MKHVVRWRHLGSQGLEHLLLTGGPKGVKAEAAVIGGEPGAEFGLLYEIDYDAVWRPLRVRARLVGGEEELVLSAEGEGKWMDAAGRHLSSLDGCIDVDIAATPFTNTPPIRRLELERGERRNIRVAYVSVPTLEFTAVDQRYVCLEKGRRYRYEGYPLGFSAEIMVDEDGLVGEYPGLFRRI